MQSPLATQILALGSLGLVGLGGAVWWWAWTRRLRLTWAQKALYTLNYAIVRVLWRAEIDGRIDVAASQGAVVVCNHLGPLDGSVVQLAADRLLHWMVAREYCVFPLFRWFFRICESIPVNRGGIDTASTKLAIRLGQQNKLVALFPEGRINTSPDILAPGRPGAALIALKARVPVVPCYISGSPYDGTVWGCLFMPAKVRLTIGRPIDLSEYFGRDDDRQVLEDLTKRFLVEMARLAGCDDFRAKLAGRFYKPGLADD